MLYSFSILETLKIMFSLYKLNIKLYENLPEVVLASVGVLLVVLARVQVSPR